MVLSKEEGALWALEHIPERHHRIITEALGAYRCSARVGDEERPMAGRTWDAAALRALVAEARTLVRSA